MRLASLLLLVTALLLPVGCAHHPVTNASGPAPGRAATDQPIVTADTALIGKVYRVNSNAKIVVLRFPVGQMAQAKQRLSVYRNGLKVGEVVVSGAPIEDMIAGDLVVGEAHAGDTVRAD